MSPKKEKLLNDTYYKWMEIGLYDLPLDGANDFVDPEIMGYGTAIDEKVLSISDYRKLINRQREQAVGLEMNFENTPVFRSISNKEDSAIFVDEIKVSIILQEGKQELFLRMTTILEYIDNKWIVLHWHGSMPTETTAETDTWLINEWKRKNEKLQKLVDEKTSELLNKNRELEIETALEKVRTIAMGMRKPDDMLDVCKSISLQLQSLGVKEIRNVQTAIFYEQRGTYMNYQFYAKHDKTFITETVFTDSETHYEFATKMLKGKGKTFIINVKGDEVKDWIAYQRTTNVFIDKYLETASSLNYYWFSLGPVALGISTYDPLIEEEINLFKRFIKVFELAYQRYLDIEKAEAQAREAQIEASLERVRAVAMGMNKSDDLLSICEVSFKDLKKLGFDNIRNALIHIQYDNQKYFMDYDFSDLTGGAITKIEYGSHPVVEDYLKQIRSAKDAFYQGVIEKDQLEEWKDFRRNSGQINDPRLDKATALYYYFFSIGIGDIGISTLKSIDESQIKILKRFRNVFALSYQRYIDISNAEAQAREAKIEAALEKIRSRALAMRNSSEVGNVSTLLFLELEKMDINPSGFSIMIFDEKQDKYELWRAKEVAHQGAYETFSIKAMYDKFDQYVPGFGEELKSAWTKGNPFFIGEFRGEKRVSFLQANREMASYSDEVFEKMKKGWPDPTFWHLVFFKYGWFGVLQNEQLIKEDLLLIHRFAEVFDFAYTRFLDLQKAEAQAREAQIQLALERVRARTMAMQSSNELKEVVLNMFDGLKSLGVDPTVCNISLIDEKTCDSEVWSAHQTDNSLITYRVFISHFEHPFRKKLIDSFLNKLSFSIHELSGDLKKSYIQYLIDNVDYSKVPDDVTKSNDKLVTNEEGIVLSAAYMKYGLLIVSRNHAISNDESDILQRFAKIFEQTYTRFLDLQKAEAQAKEAKIEAALERLRAKSMSMQKSDELHEVLAVLFEQFDILEIRPMSTHMTILDIENNKFTFRETGKFGNRSFGEHTFDLDAMDTWKDMVESWRNSEPFTINRLHFSKEKLPQVWEVFHKSFASMPEESRITPNDYPDGIYHTAGKHPFGYIGMNQIRPATAEEEQIVIKFASEFGRAYQRFLDLQKAEAQARESQIQLALERVRARTMAMQNSNELPEAANLLFQQVQSLGMPAWSAGYCTWNDDEKKSVTLWMSSEGVLQPPFTAPTTKDELFIQMRKGSEEGKTLHVVEMGGRPLVKHYQYMRTLMVVGEILDSIIEAGHPLPTFQIMHQAYFSKGFLLFITYKQVPEVHDIFKRFANVFDQTYTRFLDLQKSEAQAREAQIDAALERVRSQSMGMQSSKNFSKVTTEMFNQLRQFGGDLFATGIVFCDKHEGHVEQWHSLPDAGMLSPFIVPVNLDYIHQYRYDQWKKGVELFKIEIPGDFIAQHFKDIFNLPSAQKVLKDFEDQNTPMPETPPWEIDYGASFKQGYILVSSLQPFKEAEILPRFAKVFEQTYTRFLDLQKAETQAREAQIEAALERVRSRSMAMYNSADLGAVVFEMFSGLLKLDAQLDRCIIMIVDSQTLGINWYLSGKEGLLSNNGFLIQNNSHPSHQAYLDGWRTKRKKWQYHLAGEEKKHWDSFGFSQTGLAQLPDFIKADMSAVESIHLTISSDDFGCLIASSLSPLSEAHASIVDRFTTVFNQTYTRFLDLQKAEAQAREAQIEASMEKIRSRSLAMQKPEELIEVAEVLRKEMGLLGVEELETSSIYIVDEENQKAECWYAIKDIREENKKLVSDEMTLILSDTWVGNEMWKFYRSKKEQTSIVMKGDNRKEWINYCADKSKVLQGYYGDEIPERTYHLVKFNGGYMGAASPGDVSSESWDLLKRAAAVFSLAYTRFKDLQDAEASAREAQIEAALERVRSRTMGMQKSEELKDVIRVVYEQFVHLKINVDHAGFVVDYTPKGDWHFWIADEQDIPSKITHPYFESVWASQFNEAKEKGADFFATNLNFEEKNKFYTELLSYISGLPETSKDFYLSCPGLAATTVLLENVSLYIENFSGIPYTDEENNMLMRFGKVFQQTYTRFLDLEKAEAQAREAQIEASLERVRSKALAMHSPNDLSETVNVFFKELKILGIIPIRCGVGQIDKATRTTNLTTTTSSQQGDSFQVIGKVKQTGHPLLDGIFDHWELQKEYHPVLEGDDIKAYYNVMNAQIGYPEYPEEVTQYGNNFFFKEGFIFAWTENKLSEEELGIFRRFASVLSLTYRRYLDLKEAEERNRIIQAENDRKTKELEEARQLQLSMLPKKLPQLPNLDIAVYMKTATEVGGDYYDFNVDGNGILTFVVGDATGHGMMSGMMVSIMKSFFISNKANIELKQFFENSNNSIKDMQLGRLMMGLIGIQITTEKIIATNAGMPSLLYFRNKSQKAGEFVSNNLPLGGMKGTQYLLKEINYEKGDTLLLMSDGFAELKNSQNEQYGYVRIKEIFRSLVQKSSSGIIEELKTAASQWTNGAEPDDDITFVVIKVK